MELNECLRSLSMCFERIQSAFMKKSTYIVSYIFPVLIWMGIIFWFSAQPATDSGAMSGSITAVFFSLLDHIGLTRFITEDMLHHIIRKGAHFTIYFILGMLIYRALRFKNHGKTSLKMIGMGIVISMLYACSDEIHQLFIDGRSGQIKDVLIDTSGSMFGILLFELAKKRFEMTVK